MRSPEEIKKGLQCLKHELKCSCSCPYFGYFACTNEINGDALAYINELEARNCLNDLRDAIYEDAVAHGLWESTDYTVECCMERAYLFGFPFDRDAKLRALAAQVVYMEANELEQAKEAYKYAEELADVIIASLSVAGKLGTDIDAAVRRKMEINRAMPWKHGKEGK